MTFVNPIFLYAGLIAVPLLGIFLLWASRRRKADLARLGNPSLVQRLSQSVNWRTGGHDVVDDRHPSDGA